MRIPPIAAQGKRTPDQATRLSLDSHVVDVWQIKKVETALFAAKRVPDKHRTIDIAASYWASEIPPVPGNHLYRGMVVPDARTLRAILKNGMVPSRSSWSKTFLADLAGSAMPYAFEPNHEVHLAKGFRVLFELDRTLVPTRRSANGDHETSRPIPAGAITRLFIFNKDLPAEFPFSTYSPQELLSALS